MSFSFECFAKCLVKLLGWIVLKSHWSQKWENLFSCTALMCFSRFLFLNDVKSHCGHFVFFPSPCFSLMCVVTEVRHLEFVRRYIGGDISNGKKKSIISYLIDRTYFALKSQFSLGQLIISVVCMALWWYPTWKGFLVYTKIVNSSKSWKVPVPQFCSIPGSHIPSN